jgi:glyoxylase-like metal-dependent hydrolase (beta-lactamase superfamily II)
VATGDQRSHVTAEPSETRPAMTAQRWAVGDAKVTKVFETMLENHESIADFLSISTDDLAPHRDWMTPYLGRNDEPLMSVHAFCIEACDSKVIVDTCIGNDRDYGTSPNLQMFNGIRTSFLEDLEAVGFGRDSVDFVISTHLHPDHVGWNTIQVDGEWRPTFPNARYLVSEVDLEHWRKVVGPHNPWTISIQPLIDDDQLDAVRPPHRLNPVVSLFPTPGHTLGHVSVRLESGGDRAVITGDMVHSPVQLVEPTWTYRHDADRSMAVESVRRLLAEVADSGTLILGTHFPSPTAGRVRSTPQGWRFDDGPLAG